MKILFSVASLFAFLLMAVLIDFIGTTEAKNALVLGKAYSAAHTSVGFGNSMSDGSMVVTTSSTPEDWIIVLGVDGETVSASTTSAAWARMKEGQLVVVTIHTGCIFGDKSYFVRDYR